MPPAMWRTAMRAEAAMSVTALALAHVSMHRANCLLAGSSSVSKAGTGASHGLGVSLAVRQRLASELTSQLARVVLRPLPDAAAFVTSASVAVGGEAQAAAWAQVRLLVIQVIWERSLLSSCAGKHCSARPPHLYLPLKAPVPVIYLTSSLR